MPPPLQSPENNVPPPFLHLVSVLAGAAELLHSAHLRPALLAPINYWQAGRIKLCQYCRVQVALIILLRKNEVKKRNFW